MILILGGYIALSLILRFFTFFPTLISHDEGTYLVIAREIFLGKIYFVDLVDTKPIGLYMILGLFIRFISSSIFMIRLFLSIVVAITAFILFKISLYEQGEEKPAIAAGTIYVFFVSVWAYFGAFINCELFYLPFTALAFYLFIRHKSSGGFFAVGFLLGIGFIFKYVVLFDLAAWLMAYFFLTLMQNNHKEGLRAFYNSVIACLAFLIPFGITLLYYHHIGHLKELWFYSFGVTSRIPVERSFGQLLVYIGDFHLRFLPILFFFYFALAKTARDSNKNMISARFIGIWCLMVLLAVILPGKPFGHYFIQLMLPVSIIAGRFFSNAISKPQWVRVLIRYPTGPALLLVFTIALLVLQKRDYYDRPDMPKVVAGFLKPLLKPGDRIYTGNYHQVLYYLLEQDCPVKYVHRTLMCDTEHQAALRIDLPAEMNAMMEKDFRYILMEKPYCYEPMNIHIRENYRLLKEFPGEVRIYERK